MCHHNKPAQEGQGWGKVGVKVNKLKVEVKVEVEVEVKVEVKVKVEVNINRSAEREREREHASGVYISEAIHALPVAGWNRSVRGGNGRETTALVHYERQSQDYTGLRS